MPKHKDLKRLVRSRMEKTGESYTASRARLLAKKRATDDRAPLDTSLAGMSDEAVQARTGRTWEQWVHTLDARGAESRPHREIAASLRDELGLSAWWAQTVTVGYERIKGLREIGQRRSGHYEAHKSKTLPGALARLYHACSDRGQRERWLPGVGLTVRKATPERSMRITWEDGTSVEIGFTAKGESKSQIQIQHTQLGSRKDAEAKKLYWAERLGALAELLRSAGPST